jgi:hypothetical protein
VARYHPASHSATATPLQVQVDAGLPEQRIDRAFQLADHWPDPPLDQPPKDRLPFTGTAAG